MRDGRMIGQGIPARLAHILVKRRVFHLTQGGRAVPIRIAVFHDLDFCRCYWSSANDASGYFALEWQVPQ